MACIKNCLQIIIFIVIFSGVLGGCDNPQPEINEPISRPIKMHTVGELNKKISLRYPGTVSPREKATLAFELPGKVTDLNIKEGQLVSAGQVLAKIDDRSYQSEVDIARENRDITRENFKRYTKLLAENAISRLVFEKARRDMKVAQSNYRKSLKYLEDTSLKAPFSGRVVSVDVDPFETVQAKQPIIKLHSDSEFEMKINIPEKDWAQGKRSIHSQSSELGKNILVSFSAIPNEVYPGVITEFSGSADDITRTYEVTVSFSISKNSVVSSGMTGHVSYSLDSMSNNEIFIPVDAVSSTSDNRAYVWIYNNEEKSISKRFVKLGQTYSDNINIKSGLSAGDNIASSAMDIFSDGLMVRPLKD